MKIRLPKVLFIVLIPLLIVAIYFAYRKIKINTIICQSQYGPCSESLDNEIDKAQGKNIASSISEVKKTLSQSNEVSQYSVRFNLPSYLKIYIVEKKGEVAITKTGLDNFFILDKDGLIISQVKRTSLPTLVLMDNSNINLKVGERVHGDVLFAEDVARLAFTAYETRSISIYSDRIEFSLKDGRKIIFPTSGETDVLFGSLELILSRLNNQAQEIRIGEIDLRYKNPVLR